MPLPSAAFPEALLRRVVQEYLELPGLRLSASQARRLWGLDESTCNRLLDELVRLGFLIRRDNGLYAHGESSASGSLPRMAPASLADKRAKAS